MFSTPLSCVCLVFRFACCQCVFAGAAKASLCLSIFPSQSDISEHTETHSKLKLSNVTEKAAGKYSCRASNFVGKSENVFWLNVHKPGKSRSSEREPPTSRSISCCASPLSAVLLFGCGFSTGSLAC